MAEAGNVMLSVIIKVNAPTAVAFSDKLASTLPLPDRQLKKRMNSLRNLSTLRTNWRTSETLVSGKCPSPADVALDLLPRRGVISIRRSKCIADSKQSSLTMRTRGTVI